MYGAVVSCCSLISDLVLATTADHSPYMALEPSGEPLLSEHHKGGGAIKNTLQCVLRAHTHLTSLHHYEEILALIHIWSDSAVQSRLDGASLEIVENPLCDALSHLGSFTDTGRGSERRANEK